MNRNLNPAEFGQLFDPITEGLAVHGPQRPEQSPPQKKYMQTLQQSPNPIFSDTTRLDVEYTNRSMRGLGEPDPKEEFVPTYELESPQGTVNPYAVDHLTENSRGLDTPNVNVIRKGDEKAVYDGNHRVNAALRRGQMLIPADVYDI